MAGDTIRPVAYEETAHYLVTRTFLEALERFFKHLFRDEAGEE